MRQRTVLYSLITVITVIIVVMGVTMFGQSRTILAQDPTSQQQIAATQTVQATFNQALTATAVAQSMATLNAGGSVTANSQWTPHTQSFDGVDMVLVPPGCFLMGTSDADIAALNKQYSVTYFSKQAPQTKICFDKPFWIDKTDVTQSQFKQLGGTAVRSSYFTGDNRPVEQITWAEARHFCAKRGARLPTEAEWEYAARGPDDLAYPWGNDWNADNAVYSGNSGSQTADVGSKPSGASWVGALDMSGNDLQWVSTQYKPYPYNANDGRESTTDTNDSDRVLRGGSFYYDASALRSAYRNNIVPDFVNYGISFRCARS